MNTGPPKFCKDFCPRVLLTPDGIKMDPSKVHALVTWPTPTFVSQFKSFLGLLGYYDSFIDHLADVAFPLTELFKKDKPRVNPKTRLFSRLK